MLKEGSLVYFNPFVFKNGAKPKPKYFVVLAMMDSGNLLLASLPTSQDHVPSDVNIVRGCVNIPESNVNAFVFEKGDRVTESFCFPLRTYIYGEQIDDYTIGYIDSMSANMTDLGVLSSDLLTSLRTCLKQATNIKRSYRNKL